MKRVSVNRRANRQCWGYKIYRNSIFDMKNTADQNF